MSVFLIIAAYSTKNLCNSRGVFIGEADGASDRRDNGLSQNNPA
jgi:hypothetical protein